VTTTVAELLTQARSAGLDRLDAQLLLAHVLQQDRSWLHAHGDHVLAEPSLGVLRRLIARRAKGEPLAYLTGEKEFHGLTLKVTPAVLIPRPDTETLVDWALQLLEGIASPAVLDMGTGSGAIALALKHKRPDSRVSAVDASADALAVARGNAQRLHLPIHFILSDWWQALPAHRHDLIASNPPYIAAGDPHLPALAHEPELALTPGGDGTAGLSELVQHAPDHLKPGGWLLLEHGHDQAAVVRDLLRQRGFHAVQTRRDLGDNERCTGGQWP
jgi:release factor glutamine methyltransferase